MFRRKPKSPYPARVDFEPSVPHSDDTLRRHIAASLNRRLPEAIQPGEPLRIIANGPSARQAPLDGFTVALNGALRIFTDKGLFPTYWAACDPQELVADFLTSPPHETTYYVASKCHPAVFDALKGRDVRIWHLTDCPVPNRINTNHATTITLSAMSLFRQIGFRAFETWGWDGCSMGGADHGSGPQFTGERITALIDGKAYETTPSLCLEAQEAAFLTQIADYTVDVRGGGMIGEYLRLSRPD